MNFLSLIGESYQLVLHFVPRCPPRFQPDDSMILWFTLHSRLKARVKSNTEKHEKQSSNCCDLSETSFSPEKASSIGTRELTGNVLTWLSPHKSRFYGGNSPCLLKRSSVYSDPGSFQWQVCFTGTGGMVRNNWIWLVMRGMRKLKKQEGEMP